MTNTDHTLGYRFAGRQFYAKTYTSRFSVHFTIKNEPRSSPGSNSCANSGSNSLITAPVLDDTLAELMETLRLHMPIVQRLPLSAQTRRRLVCAYSEIEIRAKEMRLLLIPIDITAALEWLDVMQQQHGVSNSP